MCGFVFLCLFICIMIVDGLNKDALIMAIIMYVLDFLIKNWSSWRTFSSKKYDSWHWKCSYYYLY